MRQRLVATIGVLLASVSLFYNVSIGATYYLATNGSDANPGTMARPFGTIQYAFDRCVAGDILLVRGGTYRQVCFITHGGIAGSPILIRNYPGETVILDGSMDVTANWTLETGTVWKSPFTRSAAVSSSYGLLDPCSMNTSPDGFFDSGTTYALCWVDSTADSLHWLRPVNTGGASPQYVKTTIPPGSFTTTSAPPPQSQGFYSGRTDTIYVNLRDGSNPQSHRIRIAAWTSIFLIVAPDLEYITIHGIHTRLSPTMLVPWSKAVSHITIDSCDISLHFGLVISSGGFCGQGWVISRNYIHDFGGEAIHLENDKALVTRNLIENSILRHFGDAGLGGCKASHSMISHNIIRNMITGWSGIGAQTAGGVGVYLESWSNNYSGIIGCRQEAITNDTIMGNIIYNNEAQGVINSGGDSCVFANNVIYNNRWGGLSVRIGGTGGAPSDDQRRAYDNKIYNNTIYHCWSPPALQTDGIVLDGHAYNTVVRNNIIYDHYRQYTDYGINTTADHNVFTNPSFMDTVGFDFRLRSTSAAIDSGIGVGISTDFSGNPRPHGANYDVGAFEYTGLSSPPAVPVSLAPANGSMDHPATLTLRWNASTGATEYRLQVALDVSFTTMVLDDSTLSTTFRDVGPLSPAKSYYWRVKSRGPGGSSSYSSVWSFTIASQPNLEVTPVSPQRGALESADGVRLVWRRSSPPASKYWLETSMDSLFAGRSVDSSLTDTTLLMTSLLVGRRYWWHVKAGDGSGWGPFCALLDFEIEVSKGIGQPDIPLDFNLDQCYPNPFNPKTNISFQIPSGSHVLLKIYDLLGREVRTLVNEFLPPGSHRFEFEARNLASGTYICRLEANGCVDQKKIVLLK